MVKKTKTTKKISVDKSFLNDLLKSNTEMRNAMVEMKDEMRGKEVNLQVSQVKPANQKDYAFICSEVSFFDHNIVNQLTHQNDVKEFRIKLEKIMLEYKIGSVQAVFVKKMN